MYAEAIASHQKLISAAGGSARWRAALAYAYALAGRVGEAREIFEQLESLQDIRRATLYNLAALCAVLGETDQAFAVLNKVCEERYSYMIYLRVNPIFERLHSDPRFDELARRVGLPEKRQAAGT